MAVRTFPSGKSSGLKAVSEKRELATGTAMAVAMRAWATARERNFIVTGLEKKVMKNLGDTLWFIWL